MDDDLKQMKYNVWLIILIYRKVHSAPSVTFQAVLQGIG